MSGKKVIWRVAYVLLKGKEYFLKDFIIELKCEGCTGIKQRGAYEIGSCLSGRGMEKSPRVGRSMVLLGS